MRDGHSALITHLVDDLTEPHRMRGERINNVPLPNHDQAVC